ncbi:exported hypothetical protein [Paraburkholderia ribeironis]|uniref:Uncharacterized protein n=1 Tax=Paraburkholderia ribeironis TaxID=1247936 RepID=A0A1N7RJU0_9BURK|nr:exported hypothetical protein [Paraburkholderia ribeironis]
MLVAPSGVAEGGVAIAAIATAAAVAAAVATAVATAVAVSADADPAGPAVMHAAASAGLHPTVVHRAYRGDDIPVRAAAADVAAHALADLVVGELGGAAADIGGDGAGRAVAKFGQ